MGGGGDGDGDVAADGVAPAYFRCHVFCCTNRRPPEDRRGCCADKGAAALRDYMKAAARKLRLAKVRINVAGCLDRCALGPVMVIYPEGVWYGYANEADVDEILQTHLVAGGRVERLLLRPGDVTPPR